MSGASRVTDDRPPMPAASGSGLAGLLASPVVIGGALTFGFYAAIPYLPIEQAFVQRYFAGHWIEYATTALFFVGMTILAKKGLRLAPENRLLATDPLVRIAPSPKGDLDETLDAIDRELRQLPPATLRTQLVGRIVDVCGYLRGRRSSDGLDEYLKYRAELAVAGLNDSYAVVRTVTWAIPILGFLGTVIGITMAIANLKPEQLATSLNEVTGGLAVAFDTTALSLSLSIVIVFMSFVVDRAEQRVLGSVEEYGVRRLSSLFPSSSDSPLGDVANAASEAALRILERTEQLIHRQAALWDTALESMRARWASTLDRQTEALDSALQMGVEGSLARHEEKIDAARGEFLIAFEGAAQALESGLTRAVAAQDESNARSAERLERAIEAMSDALSAHSDEQGSRMAAAIEGVERQTSQWSARTADSVEANRAVAGELGRQAEVLLQIVAKEEDLARLQARLNDNLESLQSVERLDEAVHSLSAAVHLMTAKARPKAA